VSFEKKHSKVQTKNHSRFRAWGSVIVLFFSLSLHASIIANERVAFSAGVRAGSSRSPPSRFTQAILTALRDRQRHDKQNKKKIILAVPPTQGPLQMNRKSKAPFPLSPFYSGRTSIVLCCVTGRIQLALPCHTCRAREVRGEGFGGGSGYIHLVKRQVLTDLSCLLCSPLSILFPLSQSSACTTIFLEWNRYSLHAEDKKTWGKRDGFVIVYLYSWHMATFGPSPPVRR
jgi:hypothetical protein